MYHRDELASLRGQLRLVLAEEHGKKNRKKFWGSIGWVFGIVLLAAPLWLIWQSEAQSHADLAKHMKEHSRIIIYRQSSIIHKRHAGSSCALFRGMLDNAQDGI